MSKNKFKEILTAALIGALVTFLMHVVEGLVGIQKDVMPSAIGGSTSFLVYLKRVVFNIV